MRLRGERLERLKVHAGAKRLARPGHDPYARAARLEFVERREEFFNHLG